MTRVTRVIPDPLTPTGVAEPALLDLELCDAAAHPATTSPAPPRQASTPADPRSAETPAFPTADPFDAQRAAGLPGSTGEHLLQAACGTEQRAARFYDDQVLDHLNDRMREFIARMEMAFVATADSAGECDSSLRAGPAGFIEVLDEQHLVYPEYRGNGVLASLGNISENPHVGILMVDFATELIGLHVNGRARIVEDAELRRRHPSLPAESARGRTPERWVVVQVEEAYIHCRKHIPRMVSVLRQRTWGTDDARRKGGDYFDAKGTARPWHAAARPADR